MDRLQITGPHRESGTIPGEYGYGDYYRAVLMIPQNDTILAWVCVPKGRELSQRERKNLLARGRRMKKKVLWGD